MCKQIYLNEPGSKVTGFLLSVNINFRDVFPSVLVNDPLPRVGIDNILSSIVLYGSGGTFFPVFLVTGHFPSSNVIQRRHVALTRHALVVTCFLSMESRQGLAY